MGEGWLLCCCASEGNQGKGSRRLVFTVPHPSERDKGVLLAVSFKSFLQDGAAFPGSMEWPQEILKPTQSGLVFFGGSSFGFKVDKERAASVQGVGPQELEISSLLPRALRSGPDCGLPFANKALCLPFLVWRPLVCAGGCRSGKIGHTQGVTTPALWAGGDTWR